MDDQNSPPKLKGYKTCKSLRLNLEEAIAGRTWLLLPNGFRDQSNGKTYPLPSHRLEIQRLITIPLPQGKADAGVIYLRRAIKEWTRRTARRNSAINDIGKKELRIKEKVHDFKKSMEQMKADAKQAVSEVKEEAERGIANLNQLFVLGKEILEGQMRAHLNNEEWRGEAITAAAARNCVSLVAKSVKDFGLPTDPKDDTTAAAIEELAAAVRDTQEAVGLAPSSDDEDETKH